MSRYAGVLKNRICIVSDQIFSSSEHSIIEVPIGLDCVPVRSLISDYRIKDGEFLCKTGKKCAKDLKVAFISNYGDQCGIGTFSFFLFDELIDLVKDYHIFAEKNRDLTFSSKKVDQNKISLCWKRGEPLQELVSAIKVYDPDIILVEHEFGLFPNAAYFLSLLTQLSDYRVIVELHSTFPDHQDKILFECGIKSAVVHLQGAKDNLEKDKGLNIKAHLIPHGCYKMGNQEKLWNNYRTSFTFCQQGFGFRYKGFEDSIRATAILKKKYPNIFFTAVFAESPHNQTAHQAYYDELLSLIEKLGVQNNVAIIRGFQPDSVIEVILRSNQAAVFPYASQVGHAVFGASGACRGAMAMGLPVISSSIAHFSDLPTIKANGPDQIAEELDKLFSSDELKTAQIKKQNEFIKLNSFENTAKKYIAIFESDI